VASNFELLQISYQFLLLAACDKPLGLLQDTIVIIYLPLNILRACRNSNKIPLTVTVLCAQSNILVQFARKQKATNDGIRNRPLNIYYKPQPNALAR
jgi:hypothetical protein